MCFLFVFLCCVFALVNFFCVKQNKLVKTKSIQRRGGCGVAMGLPSLAEGGTSACDAVMMAGKIESEIKNPTTMCISI